MAHHLRKLIRWTIFIAGSVKVHGIAPVAVVVAPVFVEAVDSYVLAAFVADSDKLPPLAMHEEWLLSGSVA